MNRPIARDRISNQTLPVPTHTDIHTQKLRPRSLPWWILSNVKEELRPILHKFFQQNKNKTRGNTPQLILWDQHYLIPKLDINIFPPPKKNHIPIPFLNINVKILSKILANQLQQCIKRIIWLSGIYAGSTILV